MAYTAKIIGKSLEKGLLRVQVEFKSDRETFVEYFETSQSQPATWITEQVKLKLAVLESMPAVHESIVTPSEDISLSAEEQKDKASILTPRDEYAADLIRFEKYVSALAKGFTTETDAGFIELKKKLTANFKPEYLDLF